MTPPPGRPAAGALLRGRGAGGRLSPMEAQTGTLRGRTVVVTGASKGIGLAVATTLAGAGARVVAGSRTRTPELDALVGAGGVTWVEVDLGRPQDAARLVEAAGGEVYGLVNNVGVAPARTEGFLSVTDEDWQRSLDLNLLSAVRVTRAALPAMLRAGEGAVVTVASVNARLPDPLVIDYSAGKAALAAFCKALSKEVGPRGVTVNTVSPGPVETDLWLGKSGVAATVSQSGGGSADDVVAQAAAGSPTGRFTRPEEVARLVLYLLGDQARNVTGSDITIDGGLVPTW